MKLYLLTRTDGWSYNYYDFFVVAAEDENSALNFHPRGQYYLTKSDVDKKNYYGWTSKENIKIECIGESYSPVEKVIITSFNAG